MKETYNSSSYSMEGAGSLNKSSSVNSNVIPNGLSDEESWLLELGFSERLTSSGNLASSVPLTSIFDELKTWSMGTVSYIYTPQSKKISYD